MGGSAGSNTASGQDSVAIGTSSVVSGTASMAGGNSSTASGNNSLAYGATSTASGLASFAFSTSGVADGNESIVIGTKPHAGGFAGVAVMTDSQNFITTADKADQMKIRYQGGFKLVKGDGADNADGPNYEMRQAKVLTTDATVTTVDTIPTLTDSVYMIEARVVGRRTGGTAGATGDGGTYVRTAKVRNVGGVVTLDKMQSDFTAEDQIGWNAIIDVSGTNIRVRVNAAANNNVTWYCTSKVQYVQS
jgi:hypothetical protein